VPLKGRGEDGGLSGVACSNLSYEGSDKRNGTGAVRKFDVFRRIMEETSGKKGTDGEMEGLAFGEVGAVHAWKVVKGPSEESAMRGRKVRLTSRLH